MGTFALFPSAAMMQGLLFNTAKYLLTSFLIFLLRT